MAFVAVWEWAREKVNISFLDKNGAHKNNACTKSFKALIIIADDMLPSSGQALSHQQCHVHDGDGLQLCDGPLMVQEHGQACEIRDVHGTGRQRHLLNAILLPQGRQGIPVVLACQDRRLFPLRQCPTRVLDGLFYLKGQAFIFRHNYTSFRFCGKSFIPKFISNTVAHPLI